MIFIDNSNLFWGSRRENIKLDIKTFDLKVIKDATGAISDRYEKGVDVALVTDLLLLASRNAFDVAIISAGDADFFRAVEGVKEMGKEIYIASFDDSCATKLKDASLGYISLTTFSDKISNIEYSIFQRRASIP
jgi:uncharacterized LabA/DUF88 family protein